MKLHIRKKKNYNESDETGNEWIETGEKQRDEIRYQYLNKKMNWSSAIGRTQ